MEKRKNHVWLKKIFPFALAIVVLAALFFIGYFGNFFTQRSDKPSGTNPSGSSEFWLREKWEAGKLRLHFVDVGQGDCTLIELPDGKKMMIDGGDGSSEHNRTIANYLRALAIEKLDYLLLTHDDIDHYGGLEYVFDEVQVNYAYLPYAATLASEQSYLSFYKKAIKSTALGVEYSKRYVAVKGENYFLMFILPHSASVSKPEGDNASSAVVWLDYLGTSALFCGDMTAESERSLLKEYELDCALKESLGESIFERDGMKVDLASTEILKVAHHGSAYSSSLEWLQLLNFETAVVSCGAGNAYGHPAPDTLRNLKTANPAAEIYRTDECGDIVVTVPKTGGYVTVYENQSEESLRAADGVDGLFGLAYIEKKSLYTEKIILC